MHICALFFYKMVHYGIWDWCIVGFAQQNNWNIKSALVQVMAGRRTGVKPLWGQMTHCRFVRVFVHAYSVAILRNESQGPIHILHYQ